MAFNYVDTPRTEAGDVTRFTAADLSFSMAQPFPSPSKDPANDLVRQMKSRGNANTIKTPRGNRKAGPARNEFTPLLKSAAHNRYRGYRSEDKENDDDLLHSVISGHAPATPAYLKPGYREAETPGLPTNSSIMDDELTGSSQGEATPVPPAVASSSIMSTPIPILPQRGHGTLLEQGNVLTLREQEAVSQIMLSIGLLLLTVEIETRRVGQGKLQPEAQNPFSGRESQEEWYRIPARHHQAKHRTQDRRHHHGTRDEEAA